MKTRTKRLPKQQAQLFDADELPVPLEAPPIIWENPPRPVRANPAYIMIDYSAKDVSLDTVRSFIDFAFKHYKRIEIEEIRYHD